MPNFSCGGDGCGSISCRDCTASELTDRYWEEMRLARIKGEVDLRDPDFEKRARDWWATRIRRRAIAHERTKDLLKRIVSSRSKFSKEAAEILKDIE